MSTLCDPMDCSTPGFPIHHQLPELAETHVHRVGDAIQPSHPLLSPSPQSFPASGSFQMSQFFASGGQSIRVSASASVLPINIQDWFPVPGTKFPSLRIWYLQLENNNYEFASLSMYHIKMTTGGQWENSRNNLPQNISKYMSDGASLSPPPV